MLYRYLSRDFVDKPMNIESFHSRGQHLCKFMKQERFYIRKEFNPRRIVLAHQHGRRFIVLEHQHGRRDFMFGTPTWPPFRCLGARIWPR